VDLTPRLSPGRPLINSYGGGGFRIGGVRYEGSVIVLRERVAAWPVADLGSVFVEGLAAVVEAEPAVEVLLLGCGESAGPLPQALREALKREGIAVEAMDTGAACRTFNVLLHEDRRVAAALIAVS
jgi:uncharacterized protein